MKQHRVLAIAIALSMLGNTPVALAIADPNAVTINTVSVGTCGEQSISVSGTATYSESTQHLVVTLDGTEMLDSHDEPATWSLPASTLGVGSHTVVATIYDRKDGDDHEGVMAQAQTTFSVSACGTSSGSSSSSSNTSGPNTAEDNDTDCCPGSNPEPVVKKATPRVKGASTIGLSQKLLPLNSIFRKVYGRNPTLKEWNYWAHRLLTDKMAYDALYGAMQWHQLRGHTVGK